MDQSWLGSAAAKAAANPAEHEISNAAPMQPVLSNTRPPTQPKTLGPA